MTTNEPQDGSTQLPDPAPGVEARAGGAPASELPSLPARLLGVITSPGATFGRIAARPAWAGALAVYILVIAASSLVYSLNVDWESMWRTQLESSVIWKFVTSVASEGDLENFERASLNEILSLGRGGMALNTTLQAAFGTVVVFQGMLILFSTLFYLMGALGDLKLGRVYLDGLLCLLVILLSAILGAFVRGMFGGDGRAALPWQAGLSCLFFIGYLWVFHRSVERQADYKRMAASYAHAMAIPCVLGILIVLVTLLKSEPLTVPGDQVVMSSLGAMLGSTTGPIGVLLSSIDLISLWGLVVAGIGFAAATRLSLGTSLAITFLPWGFYTMARIAMAAAFGG